MPENGTRRRSRIRSGIRTAVAKKRLVIIIVVLFTYSYFTSYYYDQMAYAGPLSDVPSFIWDEQNFSRFVLENSTNRNTTNNDPLSTFPTSFSACYNFSNTIPKWIERSELIEYTSKVGYKINIPYDWQKEGYGNSIEFVSPLNYYPHQNDPVSQRSLEINIHTSQNISLIDWINGDINYFKRNLYNFNLVESVPCSGNINGHVIIFTDTDGYYDHRHTYLYVTKYDSIYVLNYLEMITRAYDLSFPTYFLYLPEILNSFNIYSPPIQKR
jgi:hypothetical protein